MGGRNQIPIVMDTPLDFVQFVNTTIHLNAHPNVPVDTMAHLKTGIDVGK